MRRAPDLSLRRGHAMNFHRPGDRASLLRRRLGALVLVINGFILIARMWLPSDSRTPIPHVVTSAASAIPDRERPTAPSLPPIHRDLGTKIDTTEIDMTEQAMLDPAAFSRKLEDTLALYKQVLVYPRWSRPIDGSTPHQLDWNHGLSIAQPFAADLDGREIEAHVTLDHSFAGPGDTLSAVIEVARAVDHAPVSPDLIAARVEVFSGNELGWQRAADVPVAPAGSAWTAQFAPARLEQLAARPRPARLVVHVEIGPFSRDLPLSFRYAANTALHVIGKSYDAVESGSLAVHFDVDVRHVQPTLVQAVLYDATGATPIATYSDWFRPKALGRQDLAIRFFGKVIRDQRIAGPYRIKQIHGNVQVPDADPLEIWWGFPDDPPMMTAAYSPTAFSAENYDSPEKRSTIAHYEDLIRSPPR